MLLAYFGSDIGPESLLRAFRKGYTLLALDTVAIGLTAQAQVPYTLIDNWVDEERLLDARRQAVAWAGEWFLSAREDLSADGICWPEFDSEALRWFWRDMALTAAWPGSHSQPARFAEKRH